MDLKYHLDKPALTFYTSSTIGDCFIRANLVSSQQPSCPIENEDADFFVSWGEYQLKMEEVKAKMKQKEMESDSNLYLCLAVHSESSCKLAVEYTSEDDGYKQINIDTFEDIQLNPNDVKLYSLQTYIETKVKVTRNNGFPYVSLKACSGKEDLNKCK